MATHVSAPAVDFGQGVSNAWTDVARLIPKLVAFLVILIIGFVIAKALQKAIVKVLRKVDFDRLATRGGVSSATARGQYDPAGILGKIVFYAIMLFVLSTAFGVFGPSPINGYLHAVIAYLPRVFAAIVIIVVAALIAGGIKTIVGDLLGGLSYGPVTANGASIAILFLGVIAALDELAVATAVVNAVLYAVLAAAVGIAIVAIGGGGITPMRRRWDNVLGTYDSEKHQVRSQLQQGKERRQAQAAREQAAREQAAREQAAREQAARDQAAPGAPTPGAPTPTGAVVYDQDAPSPDRVVDVSERDPRAYEPPDPHAEPITRPLPRQ